MYCFPVTIKWQNQQAKVWQDIYNSIAKPLEVLNDSFKAINNTKLVIGSLTSDILKTQKLFHDVIFELPIHEFLKTIQIASNLRLEINTYEQITRNDYRLGGKAVQDTKHRRLEISASANVEMRLHSIESRLVKQEEMQVETLQIVKDQNEIILNLSDYIKSHGPPECWQGYSKATARNDYEELRKEN